METFKKSEVIKILINNLGLYEEILILFDELREALSSSESSQLINTITEKKNKLFVLLKNDEGRLKEIITLEKWNRDAEISKIIEKIKVSVQRSIELEKECNKKINIKKMKINKELSTLRQGKSISKGYGQSKTNVYGRINLKR